MSMADSEYPDDVQFAGLVQAATAAADAQTRPPSSLGKRKRDDGITENVSALNEVIPNDAPDPITHEPTTPQLHSSASILFREPSSKSSKYSRPPLGNVFASLELAPENFLRLQAAAKAYMLDEAHPERREVVGHRKNPGVTNVAKLNLWNCVEEFLSGQGNGEKYFAPGAGEDIPGSPPRTMFWPQDSQMIIKRVMPLMRKMVTNERQRIYAATTRKQGTPQVGVDGQATAATERPVDTQDHSAETTPPDLENEGDVRSPAQQGFTQSTGESKSTTTFKQSIVLYVNVVSNIGGARRRIIPRFTLTPDSAPNLSTLIAEVEKRYKRPSNEETSGKENLPAVKVWLTDGLVTVVEDGEWMVSLLSAGVVDWMDGEVRVLVEV
ncbi:uncharacterized protein Z518_09281 [Rhinocladiella mackenziei CBS 650.93]|uniref:Uncharacterized protein n=1 Tax=Rhinocladiella mackenziei CBS 650.93 TaxID=1442369 RepID=A0A0D2IYB5_9EURO|nr:uncharacterized protein Z518_09281 [Rhinocladiella mackenziei CBS 650.93]KIX01555.1 hypothetical protein Z518_09281 [Rhinocladiella mackenziei CBS 650.93]